MVKAAPTATPRNGAMQGVATLRWRELQKRKMLPYPQYESALHQIQLTTYQSQKHHSNLKQKSAKRWPERRQKLVPATENPTKVFG